MREMIGASRGEILNVSRECKGICKGALSERQHVQEPVAHRKRYKKSKPSHTSTRPIASRTRLQIMVKAADGWEWTGKLLYVSVRIS